jgi:hypothetical protein
MRHRLGIVSILDRMTNSALARAAHYREQAAEFRQMAETGDGDKLQQDLLDLAEKYDALADTVLASAK